MSKIPKAHFVLGFEEVIICFHEADLGFVVESSVAPIAAAAAAVATTGLSFFPVLLLVEGKCKVRVGGC
jgi:hypothetical protein